MCTLLTTNIRKRKLLAANTVRETFLTPADFSNLETKWLHEGQQPKFKIVCLDYFFSPTGWACDRWTKGFFAGTLPMLSERGWLDVGSSIWLPHIPDVATMMKAYHKILSEHYEVIYVENPAENPLFHATDRCEDELKKCVDVVTNDNELPKLNSSFPFVKLVRHEFSLSPKRKITMLYTQDKEYIDTSLLVSKK
jgi:hypothetical protein